MSVIESAWFFLTVFEFLAIIFLVITLSKRVIGKERDQPFKIWTGAVILLGFLSFVTATFALLENTR